MKRLFGTRLTRAVAFASILTLVVAGVAFADNLQNDATVSGNNEISVGGSTSITYRLVANNSPNGDLAGCNVDESNPATVNITTPAGVTANPTSVQITQCGNAGGQSVSFSSNTAGNHSITHAISGGLSGALYNNQANFTLIVTGSAPSNAAPVISSAAFRASSVGCRVSSTLDVSFSDADSTSWSAEIDWDYDGTTFTTDTSLASVTSPFSESHTYNAPGTYTAAVRVTDNQGATSTIATASITVTQTYTVTFLSPLNGSTPSNIVLNTFKNGRVLPVKATIGDDCTLAAIDGSSSVIPTVKLNLAALPGGSTATDAVEEFADAGQSSGNTNQMRWTDDGFWIYNLDSKALGMKSGSTYRLNIFMGSVQATTAQFVVLSPQR